MKHGAPFTEEEDSYLREHYLGLACSEMADRLGRTNSSIQNRLCHLGLRKRKPGKALQTRHTIFLEAEIVPQLQRAAKDAGLSMSAYVQEIVRKTIQKKSKVA